VACNTFALDLGILDKTLEFASGEWLLSSYIALNSDDKSEKDCPESGPGPLAAGLMNSDLDLLKKLQTRISYYEAFSNRGMIMMFNIQESIYMLVKTMYRHPLKYCAFHIF
jgi:hypothetical protein